MCEMFIESLATTVQQLILPSTNRRFAIEFQAVQSAAIMLQL